MSSYLSELNCFSVVRFAFGGLLTLRAALLSFFLDELADI